MIGEAKTTRCRVTAARTIYKLTAYESLGIINLHGAAIAQLQRRGKEEEEVVVSTTKRRVVRKSAHTVTYAGRRQFTGGALSAYSLVHH